MGAARARGSPQVAEQQFSFGWKVWLGFGYAVVGPLFLTNDPLVHRDRPRRRVPRIAVRQHAALLRGLFALLLLHESLGALEIVGGVLIFAGIAWERYGAGR